ncbi:hypothetical protein D3C85_1362460 [compost metagenome]
MAFRHRRQGFQVCLFQRQTPVHVRHQALGDGGQIGPRLQQVGHGPPPVGAQQPGERVLRQVRGIRAVAQATAQPSEQPPMVRVIKTLHGEGGRLLGGRHEARWQII